MPAAKAVSTEFRRRALVGEVRATKPNKAMFKKYGLEAWLADKAAPRTVLAVLKVSAPRGGPPSHFRRCRCVCDLNQATSRTRCRAFKRNTSRRRRQETPQTPCTPDAP